MPPLACAKGDRRVATMRTATKGACRDELRPPRRVALLSESEELAAFPEYLLGRGGPLTRFDSDGVLPSTTTTRRARTIRRPTRTEGTTPTAAPTTPHCQP